MTVLAALCVQFRLVRRTHCDPRQGRHYGSGVQPRYRDPHRGGPRYGLGNGRCHRKTPRGPRCAVRGARLRPRIRGCDLRLVALLLPGSPRRPG